MSRAPPFLARTRNFRYYQYPTPSHPGQNEHTGVLIPGEIVLVLGYVRLHGQVYISLVLSRFGIGTLYTGALEELA